MPHGRIPVPMSDLSPVAREMRREMQQDAAHAGNVHVSYEGEQMQALPGDSNMGGGVQKQGESIKMAMGGNSTSKGNTGKRPQRDQPMYRGNMNKTPPKK